MAKITYPANRGRVRYVLDFEPKPKNSFIVIAFTTTGRELRDDELRLLIHGFAEARSVMKNLTGIDDLRIRHRNHNVPAKALENGKGFLQRIFSID